MPDSSVDEILELIGLSGKHFLILLANGLSVMSIGCELLGMSIIAVVANCEYSMNKQQVGFVSSSGYLGTTIAGIFMGYQMDKVGRRPIMIYTLIAGCISSTVSAFMPSYWLFIFCRFLTGISLAGYGVANVPYTTEFVKMELHAMVVNIISYFNAFAFIYLGVVATVILSNVDDIHISDSITFRPWRILVLFNVLPGIVCLLIILTLPETPKFLHSVQKNDEAYEVLDSFYRDKTGRSLSDDGYKQLERNQERADQDKQGFKKFLFDFIANFRPPYLSRFLVGTFVLYALFSCGGGVASWFPYLRNQNNEHNNNTICELLEASVQSENQNDTLACDDEFEQNKDPIIMGIVTLVLYLLLSCLLIVIPRIYTLFIFLTAGSLCGIRLDFSIYSYEQLALFVLFVTIPLNLIGILASIIVDMVPTYLRGKSLTVSFMIGRLGPIATNLIIGRYLMTHCVPTLAIFAILLLVAAFVSLILLKYLD